MKKKDTFFACLFTVSFCVCGMVISSEYFCKNMESIWDDCYIVAYAKEAVCESESMEIVKEDCDVKQNEPEEEAERISCVQPDIFMEETYQEEQAEEETDSKNTYREENAEDVLMTQTTKEKADGQEQESVVAEPVGKEYFDDALFIGDSRTVGIMEYGNIENAAFFADSGMSVFSLEKKLVSLPGEGKVSFDEVLEKEQYGKVYLMLGINELGYRFESIEAKYKETVEKIRLSQSDAVIYVCANMHVTAEQSKKDVIFNNDNVNRVNEMIAGLADNETVFYIDVNELFDDSEGGLSAEYSSDSFHVYGKYYRDWVDWLCTKAVIEMFPAM